MSELTNKKDVSLASWELVNFCEVDKFAVKSYCAVHGEDESKNLGDITKVDENNLASFTMICGGSPCFPAGTMVSMSTGERKPIEEVEVGEFVLTHTGDYKRVSKSGLTGNKLVYGVEVDNLGVYTTWNHKFLVDKQHRDEWVEFCDLRLGDWLYLQRDNCKSFDKKQITALVSGSKIAVPVYDLTVEEDHSFVANGFVVHNCQDFSLAGKQAGSKWQCVDCEYEYNPLTVHFSKRNQCPRCGSENLNKTRSSLLVEWLRIVRANKPIWGIYENVKNIVGKQFKTTFDMFITELQEYGYNCYWQVLNAKDYGIPQNRERVYLIIIQKEYDNGKFKFPEPFDNGKRLIDVLEDEVDEKYYVNTPNAQKLIEKLIIDGKLPDTQEVNNTVRGGRMSLDQKHTWDMTITSN